MFVPLYSLREEEGGGVIDITASWWGGHLRVVKLAGGHVAKLAGWRACAEGAWNQEVAGERANQPASQPASAAKGNPGGLQEMTTPC